MHRKCTGYFSDFRKIAIIFRTERLTARHPQIIILPTRTDEGRVAIVFAARNGWRWPPRCRTLDVFGISDPAGRQGQTPATRADGPSACPGDSSHERGSVSASDAPGTRSRPQSPLRAERRRMRCVRGCCLPCASAHGCHVVHPRGAAGAVKRPVVPHAPSGEKEQTRDRPPRAGLEEGR